MNRAAYVISACRTPIGKFLGGLCSLTATELGTAAVAEAIRRSGVSPEEIDEVIMGNVLSAGLGQNPARQCALRAGLPVGVAAFLLNKVCGSGLKAAALAAQAVRCGDAELVVAGGMESMSNAPYLLTKARAGYRLGHGELTDSLIHDGLSDAYDRQHMAIAAEGTAREYQVSRQDQDDYAFRSHRRAVEAMQSGRFAAEVVPVEVTAKGRVETVVTQDEGPRQDVSLEKLARLKPAFDDEGTITAGNASQLSDGACALVIGSERAAGKARVAPLARIVASVTTGLEPVRLMMAPLRAIREVRDRAGWDAADVDLYEINEAFAVQAVALIRETPVDPAKLNIHGGAVALGHPIGASGARILTTLLYGLKAVGRKRGIAALCLGGGNAVAMAVEMV